MHKWWAMIVLALVLVLLPFLIRWGYQRLTAFPGKITIAGGIPGGAFPELAKNLAQAIKEKHKIDVAVLETRGSLENLELLRERNADLAFYQAGSLEFRSIYDPELIDRLGSFESVSFVGNVSLEPINFLVRTDAGIKSYADLRGKRVNLGIKESGTYATSLLLLKHFGLTLDSIQPLYLNYDQLLKAFRNGEVDAAFATIGLQSPFFQDIFRSGNVSILSIPRTKALADSYLGTSQYTIPAGRYLSDAPVAPAADVSTIAVSAQLLTRSDTHTGLVREVTKILLSESFAKKNQLRELFVRGREFAREKPEFAIHKGALRVYETNPFLDPDVIDLGVKILSFALSFVIAVFTGLQWLKRRREREKAYKLDPFMEKLSDIERRQLLWMIPPTENSSEHLEILLKEVTELRHQALRKFTARELNEDRAVDCFIEMCHGISNEISVRLLRARLSTNEGPVGSVFPSTSRFDE